MPLAVAERIAVDAVAARREHLESSYGDTG